MSLKTRFVTRTKETRAPFAVLKTCTCLLTHNKNPLADMVLSTSKLCEEYAYLPT